MRTTSFDINGLPVDFYYLWGLDFNFSLVIEPEEGVEYSLDGKEITLTIQSDESETGEYLFQQDTGDGNISYSGLTINGAIPTADITQVLSENETYKFGITIGSAADGNRVQSRFKCLPETGTIPKGINDYNISLVDFSAEIDLASGPAGPQGIIGPAGPWTAETRLVTSSGSILATDTLVFAQADGSSIELSCPDPADIWDGANGRVITIARLLDDTGTITVTGIADGLPIELYSGESIYITTTDGINLIVSDAPFVIQSDWSPVGSIVQSGTALSALSGHRIVYGNDGFDYADKDTPSTILSIIGMTKSAAGAGSQVKVVSSGIIEEPTWNLSFPGRVFLGNDGQFTQTAPVSGALVIVGKAISQTKMIINIEEPITLWS